MEGSNANVSDLYRRLIMAEGRQNREKLIDTFENNNILRYTLKSSGASFETPHVNKNSSLEFTD